LLKKDKQYTLTNVILKIALKAPSEILVVLSSSVFGKFSPVQNHFQDHRRAAFGTTDVGKPEQASRRGLLKSVF
jgi:hypothetical protein